MTRRVPTPDIERARAALKLSATIISAALRDLNEVSATRSAAALRRRREALGLSQLALSRHVNVTRSTIDGYESGRRTNPRTLADIGAVLTRLEASQ